MFSDLEGDAGPAGLLRLATDRALLRRLQADAFYLPHRDPSEVSAAWLTWELGRLVADLDVDELWFPAGARGEPAHVLTAEAARALRGRFRRVVYADVAWASAPTVTEVLAATRWAPPAVPRQHRLDGAQVAARRAALGAEPSSVAVEAHEWTWDLPVAGLEPGPLAMLPRAGPGRTDGPLISVLTRTRGDRPQPLRRTLDSLAEQTSRDFELLLIRPPGLTLDAEVARLPTWLQEQTRQVADGGGRLGAILNDGLREARGRYFVTLDDDDETLPNWVETFAALDARSPGRVLRTASVKKFLDGSGEDEGFPLEFDLIDHLKRFRSPVSGLAYPLGGLAGGELLFDEDLEVFEDWDYLLRAAQLFGVADAPVVTSHKLVWPQLANTGTDYSYDVWRRCRREVMDKCDAAPLLLDVGAAREVRDLRARLDAAREEIQRLRRTERERD
ncbi:glycosyltransferase family A protein [Paraconexibacter sp. AEG42_29]|uniref:glycosyltransferase family A protein n=1 Tax=Paraconexibacter sp. AEG42_29 TaxID=2997339 RepID=UPI00339D62F5